MVKRKAIRNKHKIDRRIGENIWGRPKSPVNTRSYGPGEHGQRRKSKLSDFGIQLRAKQKLRGYYGLIGEKQFRLTYKEAERMRGDTGNNLVGLLEMRLDSVVYRSLLAPTIFSARQLVSHGHVLVNGKRVTIPSYRVKEGDVVSVREKSKSLARILDAIQLPDRQLDAAYLQVDHSNLIVTILRSPMTLEEIPYPVHMEPHLVVEFYAKN
jgi:small subunit ribosomal protein S4